MELSKLKETGIVSPAGFSFYMALGISRESSFTDVRAAFKQGIKELNLEELDTLAHSDAHKSLVLAKAHILQKAFEMLGDSEAVREEYDTLLRNVEHTEPVISESYSYLSWSYWMSSASDEDATNGGSSGQQPQLPAELDWLEWCEVLRSIDAESGVNDPQSENVAENGVAENGGRPKKDSGGSNTSKAAQAAAQEFGFDALKGSYGHTGRASVLAVAGCFAMEKALEAVSDAKSYVQGKIEAETTTEKLHDLEVFESCDAFPGEDAETLIKVSIEPEWWFIKRAKQACVEAGCGGFVLYHNPAIYPRAYLRPHSREELLKNKVGPSYYYSRSTLYVLPPAVESTTVEQSISALAGTINSSKEKFDSYVAHENLHDMEVFERCDAFPSENAEVLSQVSLEPEAIFIQRAKWRCREAGFGGFVVLRNPYRYMAYLRNRTRSELLRHKTQPSYRYMGCTLYILRPQQLAIER